MGRFIDKIAGTSEARATYRDAKDELERVSKRDGAETDDYLDANSAVVQAEADLPWYRR